MTRRSMTQARKRRIHERENGLCYHCGEPVPMTGPDVRYDHVIGVWLTERDEDGDVKPAHTWCDKPKTSNDQTVIAKVKRIIARREGTRKARKPIPGQKLKSAGFYKHPTMKRSFSGQVVER